MLNENSKKRSVNLFLNYLLSNSQRSKQDLERSVPPAFHLFSALYLFFSGQSHGVRLKMNDSDVEQVSVVEYLCNKLDLKPEFFEALNSYFQPDTQQFTATMIKYMRRNQALEFAEKNPGVKIPFQSLVKIPDQYVTNILNLIRGQAYQTTFFAKELDLDQTVVDFVSMLMRLQDLETRAEDQNSTLTLLSSQNSPVSGLLSKLQVQGNEFTTILRLVLGNYEPNNM